MDIICSRLAGRNLTAEDVEFAVEDCGCVFGSCQGGSGEMSGRISCSAILFLRPLRHVSDNHKIIAYLPSPPGATANLVNVP